MLTLELNAGHDFAHDSQILGRSKVAYILPSPEMPERPVFVMLHPFGGKRTSWAKHAPDLMAQLARDFVVVLPECGRNWFIDDHSGRNYEQYLVRELIPSVRTRYRANGPVSIGGFSMGGASAFFLALRHANMFASAFAVAGAFLAGNRVGDPYQAVRSDDLMMPTEAEHDRVWGPTGSQVRAKYDPAAMIGELKGHAPLPKFYFEVGRHDYPRALEASQKMSELLDAAGAEFEFACHEGGHDWDYAAAGMARLIEQSRDAAHRHG